MQPQSASNYDLAKESQVRDFFALLKPRVMTLVIFTGIIGLLLAPGEIHPLIAVIAIFCIALGSGAAGAINMWYDRDIDIIMKRTMNRPIPSGKVDAKSALEFGVVIAIFSIFIMAVLVNYIAAFILAFAIFFYVFIYTIWLKRATPQNIVIGGAAGAFPPMIGWAAVTGDVSMEPFIMFLITFFWTPPHFWALALYRSEDYSKAGIPMLPVIKGEKNTKYHILFYSILLAPITLLPFILGFSGWIYLLSAVVLNGIFLNYAYKILKTQGDLYPKKLFGYSIFYLFLIYIALAMDHFI